MNVSQSNDLCLECGLCCNGVIFADVQLEPADDAARLQSLGLSLSRPRAGQGSATKAGNPQSAICTSAREARNQFEEPILRRAWEANPKFKQPCSAFDGCRCRIY